MSGVKIAQGEWVLVCDGAKALVLENIGDEKFPNLRTKEVFEQDDARARRAAACLFPQSAHGATRRDRQGPGQAAGASDRKASRGVNISAAKRDQGGEHRAAVRLALLPDFCLQGQVYGAFLPTFKSRMCEVSPSSLAAWEAPLRRDPVKFHDSRNRNSARCSWTGTHCSWAMFRISAA